MEFGPWHPGRDIAERWRVYFERAGHRVALQDSVGDFHGHRLNSEAAARKATAALG